MHGYGVGRFTAKCRRGAEQPPRVACLPFTYRTPRGSSWPSSNPTTYTAFFLLLLVPVTSLLALSALLRSSPITLFAFRTPRRAALPFGPNYPRASVYRSDVETPDANGTPLFSFFVRPTFFRIIFFFFSRRLGFFELLTFLLFLRSVVSATTFFY